MNPLSEQAALGCLPTGTSHFLTRYVNYAKERNDAHIIYHIGTGLSILSQCVHPDLHFSMGKATYPTTYILLVGPSTESRKTGAIEIGTRILNESIPHVIGGHPDSRQGLWKSLAAVKDSNGASRQLVPYPEFGDTLSALQQQYLQPLKAAFTAAYDNLPLSQVLSKERTKVSKPRLSIIGGCAPSFLEDNTVPGDWTSGFIARFFMLSAVRERYLPTTELGKDDPEERIALQRIVKQLYKPSEKPLGHRCTGFASDDQTRWILNEWEKWVKADQYSPLIHASVARAQDYVVKLALLLAWDNGRAFRGDDFCLTAAELGPAVQLAKWHVMSAKSISLNLAVTRDQRDRKTILSVLPTQGAKAIPLSAIIREAKLLKRRVIEILESLKEEQAISFTSKTDPVVAIDIPHYYKLPELNRSTAPASLPQQGEAGGKVLPFRRPASPQDDHLSSRDSIEISDGSDDANSDTVFSTDVDALADDSISAVDVPLVSIDELLDNATEA